ncbi:Tol-Pal system beta propeller repeat protein TolB [candidate division GN15 bacterium]|nr:Tol-Pal system beta propeller repeat protein TolB [candidate division GN15 bacterium]
MPAWPRSSAHARLTRSPGNFRMKSSALPCRLPTDKGLSMRTALLVLLTVLFVSGSLAAQDNIRTIPFDTISGGFRAIPIAVDQMTAAAGAVTPDDSALMRAVTGVIQYDLDFYADFELIPVDSFFVQTYELTELNVMSWGRLGADYVVFLECQFPGPNMLVNWRLVDTRSRREISDGRFDYHRQFWRLLAHDIANQIVQVMTGDPGIFRTKIVYVKKIGQAKELFLADFDGANERQLTDNGSLNVSPAFAPDLEHIYFTSYMDGPPQLYRVDVISGVIEQVAEYPGSITAPSVSPDGKKIACVLSKDGNHEIYVLDLQGRIIKRVTRHPAIESSPTWSPDGRYIAYSSDRTGSPQIYVSDADGIDTRRLTFVGGYNDSPVWSRRGDRITFVSRTPRGRFDLASIDTSGYDYRVMTQLGTNENPHFSPDGKHIVFSSTRLSSGDIFTMDVSGRNQRRLTREGNISNPAWGPIPKR